VAELVDALDLGSSGFKPWEFKSLHPHQYCSFFNILDKLTNEINIKQSNLINCIAYYT